MSARSFGLLMALLHVGCGGGVAPAPRTPASVQDTFVTVPTQFVEANGTRYAYRRYGTARRAAHPVSGLGHGFLFQYPHEFAAHVSLFLRH